ncbi:Na+/H+ antiporter NhaC-like protein [Desulfotomaculum nigrificans CO-1-SRB]|uniref:Na+/H+ antiporter NhaC-like protein n=1 Tax=Desulfotomaculum nigrificans (strain DSM 14880 / VKM B-2319 / CO-1-SRB) TaxID=868595 RepID=F6B2M5_DESCC|nr:Na+/H+ antiporter NhaC family protein [Desulfotomaculum nigrificans]AEF93854.1 Na+/H+ antiporter NhaC-like protein [Desulfotomaculum nigrificans CO-1-SRB]
MQQISFLAALTPIVVLITSIYLTVAVYHININYGLAFAVLVGMAVALQAGVPVQKIWGMIIEGVKPTVYILLLFLLIGVLIGTWHLSGTIPAMIYYGLHLVHPQTFYLSSFIICCIVSMLLGTSMGTVSTVGVALMGIAHRLGLSLPATAGAVVSGAFFGDRSSPLSSSANLTAVITGTELYSNLRYMINTIIAPVLISAATFYLLGQWAKHPHLSGQLSILSQLARSFDLNPVVLLPPLLVLILSLLRVNTQRVLMIGALLGMVVAVYWQHAGLAEIIRTAVMGYHGPARLGELNQVIKGGGMVSFINMDLVIIFSAALTGILEGIGALNLLLKRILMSVRSLRSLTILSIVSSILMLFVTANQTLAIIIPGKVLLPLYRQFSFAPKNLARNLADSGVMVVPLIPWSVAGLICANVLGVSTMRYLPFALLCWVTPLMALLVSLLTKTNPQRVENEGPLSGS